MGASPETSKGGLIVLGPRHPVESPEAGNQVPLSSNSGIQKGPIEAQQLNVSGRKERYKSPVSRAKLMPAQSFQANDQSMAQEKYRAALELSLTSQKIQNRNQNGSRGHFQTAVASEEGLRPTISQLQQEVDSGQFSLPALQKIQSNQRTRQTRSKQLTKSVSSLRNLSMGQQLLARPDPPQIIYLDNSRHDYNVNVGETVGLSMLINNQKQEESPAKTEKNLRKSLNLSHLNTLAQ